MIGDLLNRKFINRILPANKTSYVEELLRTSKTLYVGFDPTYPSLHLGHLSLLIASNLLFKDMDINKNKVNLFYIIGDNTAKFKDFMRPSIDNQEEQPGKQDFCLSLENQIHIIQDNISKNFNQKIITKTMRNSSFFNNIEESIDRLASICKTMKMKDVQALNIISQSDLTNCISQIIYPCYQTLDWQYLMEKYNCNLQIGGSDQEGNISMGMSVLKNNKSFKLGGITTRLIEDVFSKKIGKTDFAASKKSLSTASPFLDDPYRLYRYIMKLPDSLLAGYFNQLTIMKDEEIIKLLKELKPGFNLYGQKILAREILKLCFNDEISNDLLKLFKYIRDGKVQWTMENNDTDIIPLLRKFLPKYTIKDDTCSEIQNFVKSIGQKNIYVNNMPILSYTDRLKDEIVITIGKNDYAIIKIKNDN